MVNPYVLVAAAIAIAIGCWKSYSMGFEAAEAKALSQEKLLAKAEKAFSAKAAEAISKIGITHETIIQPATTIIRQETRYRECLHDDRVFDTLNGLLRGDGFGGSGLPEESGGTGR